MYITAPNWFNSKKEQHATSTNANIVLEVVDYQIYYAALYNT